MVELIHDLRDNGFDVHIFTADEGAFLRLVAAELYGNHPTTSMAAPTNSNMKSMVDKLSSYGPQRPSTSTIGTANRD